MPHSHTNKNQHSHGNACSGHGEGSSKKVLLIALIITSIFMVVEVVGGIVSGSLALIADAGHMMTDAGALLLAFAAVKWSAKPKDSKRSYGYARLQVLAAFANGIALLALTIWIVVEAVGRFNSPEPIESMSMFVVAVIGLLVNIIVFKMLHSSSKENINVRGAMLHVLGDLLGSVGAILAAILIYWKNWLWADPVLSVFVSLLIVKSALRLIKESSHILLEGTPPSLDVAKIENELSAINGVNNIHHLHVWCLNENKIVASLHATLEDLKQGDDIIAAISSKLKSKYGIEHSTIQLETKHCDFIEC
ncbi:MAG: cation transporter [Gammaproteobacteria bacterium]|nr:cation transporter [Gammaproteobacteria bacterium]